MNQGSPTIPVSGQRFTLFVRDNTGLVEAGATMVDAASSDIFTLTGGAADQAIVAIDIGLGGPGPEQWLLLRADKRRAMRGLAARAGVLHSVPGPREHAEHGRGAIDEKREQKN